MARQSLFYGEFGWMNSLTRSEAPVVKIQSSMSSNFRISEFQLEHALRFKAVCLIAIAPSMSRFAATGAADAEFRMNINGLIGQNFTELGGSCAPRLRSAHVHKSKKVTWL